MTKAVKELTPMQKQYQELKKKHPDALLLFRCGDFYETYDSDASIASAILGITLTKNNKTGVNMAGFPHHALDTYLPKLIRAGKRVAICDQLEDPKTTTKLVKRGITEIITPTGETETNQQTSTNNIETTMTNEEMNTQIEQVKKEAQATILAIASETIKALGGKLPTTLNSFYADAIGKLELIKLKNSLNAEITKSEMLYLIEWAEKGLNSVK